MLRLSVALVLAAASYVSAQAGVYQQCGGIGWSGATTCVPGATCTALGDYYSQCVPGSAPTSSTSTSSSTTSKTLLTTSRSTTIAPSSSQQTTLSSTSTAAQPSSSTTGVFTIFAGAGNYVSNIATYQFDAGAKTLKVVGQSTTGQNPSWIALHPTRKNLLYTTNENYDGRVQSFTIGSNGALNLVSTVASGGDGPTHLLPLSTGHIAVANYNGGTAGLITTSGDGSTLAGSASVVKFSGNPSHPHQAYEYNGELFIPDLGADKIWRLKVSGSSMSVTGSIPQPAGSGPRHMQISGGQLFILHELSSTLSVQPLPSSASGTSSITSTVNIIPPGVPSGNTYAAAELLIPPTSAAFPATYIYASNRNIGYNLDSRGDAITIIQNSGGQLSVVGYVFTGLDQIRGMQFGGPDKRYLIAGSATGAAGVAVFERTDGGKTLTLVARDATIPIRTTFAWWE